MCYRGFWTLCVFKGFSTAVSSLVFSKKAYVIKYLPTRLASVRFCSVSFLVLCELMAMTKGLSTFFAFIGLLPCVNSLVPKELWLPGKSLPTVTTLEGLLSSMGSLMMSET